jgi:hypothetical protein
LFAPVSFLFGFISEVLRSLEASEGLAPFLDRECVGARSARPVGRVASSRKKELCRPRIPGAMSPVDQGAGKTRRSIRCPARIRPPEKARTGFEPWEQRTGASPSCLRSISRSRLRALSLQFAHPRRSAAAFKSGALRAPFIQQRLNLALFRVPVKNLLQKVYPKLDARNRNGQG